MIAYIFLLFVLGGTSYAAYLDLKTTEVPDYVSLIIGGGAVVYYLFESLTFTVTDAYLILGTIAYGLGVATFLRLYALVEHDRAAALGGRLFGGGFYGMRKSDIGGVLFFGVAAGLYGASVLQTGVHPVVLSITAGTGLFALGWFLYLLGMWGGADAFVLGAVGYAFPYIPVNTILVENAVSMFPVPLTLLITVFMVGSVYSILYAIVVAVLDKNALQLFMNDLREQQPRLIFLSGMFLLVAAGAGYVLHVSSGVPLPVVLQQSTGFFLIFLGMLLLYRFLKIVETEVMHTTVPVNELEPGDVLAEELGRVDEADGTKIVGLTEQQIARIQDAYDQVEIKTGVRFIAAFPIAIMLLILVGNPIYAFALLFA